MRLVLAALLAALAAAVSAGAEVAAPTPIVLGTTAPLTGLDSADASAAIGATAYFDYVSAHGGVGGRPIRYAIVDDGSGQAGALAGARRLVEQSRVLAVVNPVGTEESLAMRGYLNGARVPQLFVDSGAATFGADAMRYPWTIGFRPSYGAEGWIYGRFLARMRAGARVAVLAESDELGRELFAGLRDGAARSTVSIAAPQTAPATAAGLAGRMAKLKASGADVLALFVSPALAGRALGEAAALAWKPAILVAADSSSAVSGRGVAQAYSVGFLKDPTDPRWVADPAMRLYRTILARYAKGAKASDPGYLYGMAVAWTTVELLKRAGPQLTRESLMTAARSLRLRGNPFLLPGIGIQTSATDGSPVEQGQLRRFAQGRWRALGGLWSYPDG